MPTGSWLAKGHLQSSLRTTLVTNRNVLLRDPDGNLVEIVAKLS